MKQLKEFQHLQVLFLTGCYSKPSSYSDSIIEDCPHLKEVSFSLHKNEQTITATLDSSHSPRPRPDIQTVISELDIINHPRQLDYFMTKFCNLQVLVIKSTYRTVNLDLNNCSTENIINFFRFAIFIPSLEIEMPVTTLNSSNLWIYTIKTKSKIRHVALNYHSLRISKVHRIKLDSNNLETSLFLSKYI